MFFRHSDTCVDDTEGLLFLVIFDFYLKGARVVVRVGGEHPVLDFVEGITCVRNQLAKEDVFVGVQGVDDDIHESSYVSLELMCLAFLGCLGLDGGE